MLSPRDAFLTLNLIPGLGPVRLRALLDVFGSPELVLDAPRNLLVQVPRIGNAMADAIADWRNCTNAAAEVACAKQLGCRIITLMDEDYPAALRHMDDPPTVLYVRGELRETDFRRSVAIVGTRQATAYGHTQARRFGRELADYGSTIISGLARGIDTEAHLGAMEAGGRTIAVLGFGMANFYPQENAELAERICNGHGALISEFPLYLKPGRTTFPQRNRIVAAWADATLVVEAPSHSGAMHTATLAAGHYGKTVFAVPGPVHAAASAGCHDLIRDGAILCTSPQQLRQDMQWDAPRQMELFDRPAATEKKPDSALPPKSEEAHVLAAIRAGHDSMDTLPSAVGMKMTELNPLLMRLQIQGLIMPLPGARFCCRS